MKMTEGLMKDFIGGVVPEGMNCDRIKLFDKVHTLTPRIKLNECRSNKLARMGGDPQRKRA
jgi:hypothetical protein